MHRLWTIALLVGSLASVPAASGSAPASDDTNGELEALVGQLLPRAELHLRRYSGFPPFGGVLDPDGKVSIYVGSDAQDPNDSDENVLGIASGLRVVAHRGEALAVCLVVLVRIPPPGREEKVDAIWLRAEHRSGLSKSVFYPYDTGDGGEIELGEPFTVLESPDFFAPR